MTTFLEALDNLVGLTEPHEDDYQGETWQTPSLINNDDRKENDGEEAPRAAVRTPRT